jgi:hypothetical protein
MAESNNETPQQSALWLGYGAMALPVVDYLVRFYAGLPRTMPYGIPEFCMGYCLLRFRSRSVFLFLAIAALGNAVASGAVAFHAASVGNWVAAPLAVAHGVLAFLAYRGRRICVTAEAS